MPVDLYTSQNEEIVAFKLFRMLHPSDEGHNYVLIAIGVGSGHVYHGYLRNTMWSSVAVMLAYPETIEFGRVTAIITPTRRNQETSDIRCWVERCQNWTSVSAAQPIAGQGATAVTILFDTIDTALRLIDADQQWQKYVDSMVRALNHRACPNHVPFLPHWAFDRSDYRAHIRDIHYAIVGLQTSNTEERWQQGFEMV